MRLSLVSLVLAAASAGPVAAPAHAGSHLWRFNEFYSSPDRRVQFIEMQEIGDSDNETAISDHWFQTNTYNLDHSELLGQDLPFGTANKKFLVGTESYAALQGVPEPDYVLPDGFLNPDGDTVVWWFYQLLEIPVGVMPSNGIDSITVDDPSAPTSFIVGPNSPTNFAGETGSVQFSQVPALPGGGAIAAALSLLLASAAFELRRRRRGPA